MTLKPIIFAVIPLFLLTACAQFEPFIDARREAGQDKPYGASTPQKPVICYGLFSTPEQRQELADTVCQKNNQSAKLIKTTHFSCRLITPMQDYFDCVD